MQEAGGIYPDADGTSHLATDWEQGFKTPSNIVAFGGARSGGVANPRLNETSCPLLQCQEKDSNHFFSLTYELIL